MKKFHIPQYLKKILIVATFGLFPANHQPQDAAAPGVPPTKTVVVPRKPVKKPIINMAYKTDTLDVAKSTLMFYSAGMVTRNYVENNNAFRMQMPYFEHEEHHHTNDKTRYRYKYKLKPFEYYKLCMHDEISANITAILTARFEYLAAENKEAVIEKYKKTYMGFYFQAIKEKKIDPTDKFNRENEWRFIANGTRNMWMKKYAKHYAQHSTYKMLGNYIDRVGLFGYSAKNYDMLVSKFYKIGGVDFWQYMDEDISPQNTLVTIKDNLNSVMCLKESSKDMHTYIDDGYTQLEKISISNQDEAFHHLIISSRLKTMLKGVSEEDLATHPQIITSCYVNILNNLKTDISYKEFFETCNNYDEKRTSNLFQNEEEYKESLRKMYTFNNVDLLSQIQNFDIHDVPEQPHSYDIASFNFGYHYIPSPMFAFSLEEDANIRQLEELKKNNKENNKQAPEPTQNQTPAQPKRRNRSSEVMHLAVPNFEEPILTDCTPEQFEEILDAMRQFNEIPDVLKGCNTQAINEYKAEQIRKNKETYLLDSLQNKQTKEFQPKLSQSKPKTKIAKKTSYRAPTRTRSSLKR